MKDYSTSTYIAAAIGFAIINSEADLIKSLNRAEDFARLFTSFYGRELSENALEDALDLMVQTDLIVLDDDRYAGKYYTLQKTSFNARFKTLAEQVPDSPLAVILRGRVPWIESVFVRPEFWTDIEIENDDLEEEADQLGNSEDVPASDRVVTLLHNSAERSEAEQGLESISETIRVNNEIAAQLGDDRERISAELEASRIGLKPEKVRVGFIRDTVLRVLREIGTKLKDKAIEFGLDRLIALFESLIDSAL